MPCLNPIYIKNKKYLPNKSNGGNPPPSPDIRLNRIAVPCGKCYECRRRRGSDWRFRLLHEFAATNYPKMHFVTLTFSDESFATLYERLGSFDATAIIKRSVRLFLERYRKKYGVSLRHFFVSELGEKTDRLHIHGIIMDCKCGFYKRGKWNVDIPLLASLWSYGHVFVGYCNAKTISYVTKYITKIDSAHPDFRSVLLVSPGFGASYANDDNIRIHHSFPGFIWHVRSSTGHPLAMPRYLKLKIFTEEELTERSLYLLDNPPDLIFRGHIYTDYDDYRNAVLSYFHLLNKLGANSPVSDYKIHPNTSF